MPFVSDFGCKGLSCVSHCRGSRHGGMRRALAEGCRFLGFATSVLANAAVLAETPCPCVPGIGRQPAECSGACRDLQPCFIPAAGNQVHTRTRTPALKSILKNLCILSRVRSISFSVGAPNHVLCTHKWETTSSPKSDSAQCVLMSGFLYIKCMYACTLVKMSTPFIFT